MENCLGLLICAAALCGAQEYALGPDSQRQAGVPAGVVTFHTLPPGRFYPGTPHNYSVYVPAQYQAAKPAPFMIFLDGSGRLGKGERVPVVFDNLIAKGDLPPMIGIFVDPGVLPAVAAEAQNRFERVFEYDSLSERYSRFLLEELIPEVAKQYNLSPDPNDRGLAGVSTGAVGAFAAAWNRPDQFRRVLSFIGTFVAMKGADSLPALIRKTEPKPIRVFLQAGRNDHIVPGQPYGTFFGGSWPINNQVIHEAFQFAGYDARLVLGEEGHNMKQGGAIMPDALRWLWREYPKPIVAGAPPAMGQPGWDPRGKVSSTVWAGKPWEQVGGAYGSVAGLAADRDGNVFFSDPGANRIYRSDPAGSVVVFKENTDRAGALRVGPEGRIYAAEPGRKRIVSYGAGGGKRVVARDVAVTDFAITAKGAIYFTDSFHKTVGMVGRAGTMQAEMGSPAGLTLSGDQAMLVAADAQARFSWSFQIAADGSLANGEPFYRLEMPESGWMSGAAGVAEDSIGQVYFATAIGIQVCEANGRVAMILNTPEHGSVSGIAFGGKGLNWLYVTQGGKLFRRPVQARGVAGWDVVKLPKPPL
ncbi:MAG: alpha/beta hydrolase-fold protein [Acidobacteria bacterium]|nr:alpha/beta hydrolase-fold protein [Acidobacteriota bacterium]